MHANPMLKKLGFSDDDRVVILHADDIGMCQGSVSAYADLLEFGILSSAAAMVPCPWFPATAAYCRQQQANPRLDMGVHLTLTSEWESYRWRPLSTNDKASGIIDDQGYFYRLSEDVYAQGDITAVEQEIKRQIESALAAGLDLTHMDSHMISLFHPRFLPSYFRAAQAFRLPAFMIRREAAQWQKLGYDEERAVATANITQQAEEQGFPLCDHFYFLPLNVYENRLQEAKRVLDELPVGITHFVLHPVHDTPEIRAMAPDWRSRVADYQLFINDAWRQAVAAAGVHVIGYRALRDVMRETM